MRQKHFARGKIIGMLRAAEVALGRRIKRFVLGSIRLS
jgi:hypothetical protein